MTAHPEGRPESPPAGVPVSATARDTLDLAVPAFLALVIEPLFLVADSAIIGHLGTVPLAGLGIASTVLLAAAGLFVFLAYATTSVVARALGSGDRTAAMRAGLDGLWLAVVMGLVLAAVVAAVAPGLVGLVGGTDAALEQATTYLRIAALGLPGMLVVFPTTGVLRALRDTRTPLVATILGFGGNIVLTLLFVYGFGWGIAGSAWGTVIAQSAMALGLVLVVLHRAGLGRDALHPQPAGILRAALDGFPLFLRTVALRAAIVVTVWAAAAGGNTALASHHVAMTVWSALAFTLDALAIAAQALVGLAIGSGDRALARAIAGRLLTWGVGLGAVLAVLVWSLRVPLAHLFTADPQVVERVTDVLALVAAGQLVAGYVFVADGVLMAAGDFRYLAVAMVLALAVYLPIVVLARGRAEDPEVLLRMLWLGYLWFTTARAVTLWWRIRGPAWLP